LISIPQVVGEDIELRWALAARKVYGQGVPPSSIGNGQGAGRGSGNALVG